MVQNNHVLVKPFTSQVVHGVALITRFCRVTVSIVIKIKRFGNLLAFFMFLFSRSLLKYDVDPAQITKGFEM